MIGIQAAIKIAPWTALLPARSERMRGRSDLQVAIRQPALSPNRSGWVRGRSDLQVAILRLTATGHPGPGAGSRDRGCNDLLRRLGEIGRRLQGETALVE